MLASIFIVQGFDTMLHPERVSPAAEPVVQPLAERAPVVPEQTEQAVRINGAVQFAGGLLLAMGRLPRLSAMAIAATLVPTTLAGHRYWESEDKQERAAQRIHFMKNMSMLGGLLLAAVDTAGNPSLAWRGRHAVQSMRRDLARVGRTAKAPGKAGAGRAAKAPGKPGASRMAKAPGKAAAGRAAKVSGKAGASRIAKTARQASASRIAKVSRKAGAVR
jgi:uncharacterized membrane protein YphA (DoxX/SURF4 family)